MVLQEKKDRRVPVLALLFASAVLSLTQPEIARSDTILRGRVSKVLDGDTIVVEIGGESRVVRLIGIDCPEVEKNGKPGEYMSKEAKDFVREVVEGKDVSLEFDMEEEDRYGRLLCYVIGEDGKMVNAMLLKNGLALTLTYFPFREKRRFMELEGEAKRSGKGLFHRASQGVIEHIIATQEPAEVYRGPSRTYTVVYRDMGKPWLRKTEVAEEIGRLRRYEKDYHQSQLAQALKTDGYIPLKERENTSRKKDHPIIDYREAGAFIGRYVIIRGEVVRTKNTGKVTFLDFDDDWRTNLSIVIFAEDASKFPVPPEDLFRGKMIRVRGKIKLYKGKPEIIVSDPKNIEILK